MISGSLSAVFVEGAECHATTGGLESVSHVNFDVGQGTEWECGMSKCHTFDVQMMYLLSNSIL